MRLISAGSLVRAQSGPVFRAISQVRCLPSVTNKNRLYARQIRDGVPIKHVISYYHQKRRVVSHGSDNGFAQSVQTHRRRVAKPCRRLSEHLPSVQDSGLTKSERSSDCQASKVETVSASQIPTIRHNSPMIPLLSGSMGASHTFCDWIAALRSRTSSARSYHNCDQYKRHSGPPHCVMRLRTPITSTPLISL